MSISKPEPIQAKQELQSGIQESLITLRLQTPLVHNITNTVVMNNTANALLALGASPLMSDAEEEIPVLTNLISSLVINIGTLTQHTVAAMELAASEANKVRRPWVLDPVGAGATPFRLDTARTLMQYKPTVVRGNAAEIQALFDDVAGDNSRGVDSLLTTDSIIDLAMSAAQKYNVVIAMTGAVDIITDGQRIVRIHNGDPMMTRITGTGCTATALVGAFIAIEPDALIATCAGLSALAIAGELGAQNSRGPGSLQLNILDELYNLTPETLINHLNLEAERWDSLNN